MDCSIPLRHESNKRKFFFQFFFSNLMDRSIPLRCESNKICFTQNLMDSSKPLKLGSNFKGTLLLFYSSQVTQNGPLGSNQKNT